MSLEVAYKVPCPFCNASLRSRAPIPAGTPLRCPSCNQVFSSASSSSAISSPTRNQQLPTFPMETGSSSPVPIKPKGNGIFLALGGVVVLCLVSAFVMWHLFAADAAPTKGKKEHEVSVVVKPATPVVAVPLITLDADEEAKIQAAVAKGVAWLRSQQRPDGTFLQQRWPEGETAMVGLVLLQAGVPADDPSVKKAAMHLRSAMSRMTHTYTLALTILFFDKLKDPLDEDLLREAALRLVAGQRIQGGWEYDCPTLTAGEHASLLAMLNEMKGADAGTHRLRNDDAWSRMPATMRKVTALSPIPKDKDANFFKQGGDNSNTQFALLALWTARRHGVPVDAALERVVHRFRRSQEADGSWKYVHAAPVGTPTMTCAGLLALAVGTGLSDERTKDAVESDAVKKAFKKLGGHIGTPISGEKAPPPADLYFLWSVERVGVLYHRARIEDKDWYRWGAFSLLRHQHKDGLWHTNTGPASTPLSDTCFAILFLQRANLATDLSDRLRRAAQ